MIYITGDCHGRYRRFSSENFPEQEQMTKDDFIIVCGDFGIWHKDNEEINTWKWLNKLPFTILFVGGNHENYDRLYSDEFEIVDFHGGKAQKISENIYYLMRGEIYSLCGKKFFCFGGASSHDIADGILDENDFPSYKAFLDKVQEWRVKNKMFRINHMSWWKQELPTEEEINYALKNLEKHNNTVDFIVTHCAPQNIASYMSCGKYAKDVLTVFFDKLSEKVKFKKWFFGHYHNDENIFDKYVLLYYQIIRIV